MTRFSWTTKLRGVLYTVIPVFIFCAALSACSGAWAGINENTVRRAWRDVTYAAKMELLPLSIKEDKSPNAWVTAGQSVTVTTGLMELLESRAEIFGVLAHEAGHAKLGHYEKRVSNAAGIGLATAVLGYVIGDSTLANVALGIGSNLATAGFSREQEVAADDFSVDLAFSGHSDPTGLYTALRRISIFGGETTPSGFNSHPPDERRLKHVKERILSKKPDAVFKEIEKKKAD
ncbi:MAG: M48 family metalloprotease [Synergistaceae bacterium]|jgi:putative metalloprotease|nr:M48 family metalloprotease [Synergistaceae bacterium]